MTINKNEIITLPKWLVIVVAPMLVSAVISFGVFRASSARQEEKVLNTQIAVDKLDKEKVDRNEFIIIQSQLNRIEEKVDNHYKLTSDSK